MRVGIKHLLMAGALIGAVSCRTTEKTASPTTGGAIAANGTSQATGDGTTLTSGAATAPTAAPNLKIPAGVAGAKNSASKSSAGLTLSSLAISGAPQGVGCSPCQSDKTMFCGNFDSKKGQFTSGKWEACPSLGTTCQYFNRMGVVCGPNCAASGPNSVMCKSSKTIKNKKSIVPLDDTSCPLYDSNDYVYLLGCGGSCGDCASGQIGDLCTYDDETTWTNSCDGSTTTSDSQFTQCECSYDNSGGGSSGGGSGYNTGGGYTYGGGGYTAPAVDGNCVAAPNSTLGNTCTTFGDETSCNSNLNQCQWNLVSECYVVNGTVKFSNGSGHSCQLCPNALSAACAGVTDVSQMDNRANDGGNIVDGVCSICGTPAPPQPPQISQAQARQNAIQGFLLFNGMVLTSTNGLDYWTGVVYNQNFSVDQFRTSLKQTFLNQGNVAQLIAINGFADFNGTVLTNDNGLPYWSTIVQQNSFDLTDFRTALKSMYLNATSAAQIARYAYFAYSGVFLDDSNGLGYWANLALTNYYDVLDMRNVFKKQFINTLSQAQLIAQNGFFNFGGQDLTAANGLNYWAANILANHMDMFEFRAALKQQYLQNAGMSQLIAQNGFFNFSGTPLTASNGLNYWISKDSQNGFDMYDMRMFMKSQYLAQGNSAQLIAAAAFKAKNGTVLNAANGLTYWSNLVIANNFDYYDLLSYLNAKFP